MRAKSGLIRKVLIKRRRVEIPANFVGPLKIRRHLVELLAIRILIPNAGIKIDLRHWKERLGHCFIIDNEKPAFCC